MSRGTLCTDDAGRLCRRTIILEVVEGADRGLQKKLSAGSVVVGAHRDCDVVLTDPRVSRRHCEVALVDDGVRVRDLDSTNGVKVGDAKVAAAVVAAGSVIVLGDTTIRLVARDEIVPATTAHESGANAKLGDLTTKSASMANVLQILARAAKTDATILLVGEAGVGKKHIARTLHHASRRRTGPLVAVDCAGASPALLPSQLFGHKKGAFAGAADDRGGAFEAAGGGTLFLDGVDAVPAELQPQLLRVLETRCVVRVGESHARAVDVRVIAGARALDKLRDDVRARLAVIRVVVPALRARREDVPVLVKHFLVKNGKSPSAIAPKDLQQLVDREWPRNVRELREFVERACALGDIAAGGASDGRIDLSKLPHLPEIGGDDDDMEAPTVPSSPPSFSSMGPTGGRRRRVSSAKTRDGRARTDLDSATEPEVNMNAAVRAAIAGASVKGKPSIADADDDDDDVRQEDPTDRASKRHKAATNAQIDGEVGVDAEASRKESAKRRKP